MDLAYALVRPLLFRLDAEDAHEHTLALAAWVARSPALTALARALVGAVPDPRLARRVMGLDFPSPIGLAAGLDKNGVAIDLWAALGFGFVEVGTVTPGAGQPGNDRPRLARVVEDRALVNRMGFNNAGVDALVERLRARRTRIPVGANLGKAKLTPNERALDDYLVGLRAVWAHVDYVTINVSSPNTPNLRDLQAVESLGPLLRALVDEAGRLAAQGDGRRRPLVLKVSPDLADDDLDAVADVAVAAGVDGVMATNTTIRRELLSRRPPIEGGVSGAPLRPRAQACVERLAARLAGRAALIGVGGIGDGPSAAARLMAGADLVQVYSALVFEGPGLVARIQRHLLGQAALGPGGAGADATGRTSTPSEG